MHVCLKVTRLKERLFTQVTTERLFSKLSPEMFFVLFCLVTLGLSATVLAVQKRPRHKGAPRSFITLKLSTWQADKPFRPWRTEIGPTWGSKR
jgi:hypothetical protein